MTVTHECAAARAAAGGSPAAARQLPGIEGVWVFVAADLFMFAMMFLSFIHDRMHAQALFEASRRTLDADYGGVNTLVLLTSSWLVVMAVRAARDARHAGLVAPLLAAATACGVLFALLKASEYRAKLAVGISMLRNDFYMYYFVLTGIHLAHVVAGTLVLAILWRRARRGRHGPAELVWLESGATFWHMVDLLWIVLFPLLYLVR